MNPLKPQEIITSTWKGNIAQPVVSICCATYNHEQFIEDALKGFLIQHTDFPFEIIIRDDASTDNTTSIIKEYEKKYSKIIKVICEKENQFLKGVRPLPSIIQQAKGDFIAICEGDDYWLSENKLQKQVDFLRSNKDFVLVFHNAIIKDEVNNQTKPFSALTKSIYSIEDVISEMWFVPTQSIVFRKESHELPTWRKYVYNGDYSEQLILANKGLFYCIDECMSIYRLHGNGLSSDKTGGFNVARQIETLVCFNYYTDFKYNDLIQGKIVKLIDLLDRSDTGFVNMIIDKLYQYISTLKNSRLFKKDTNIK